ncbi:hypothetical protein GUJ93_ZPchr0014g47317 [Zizania palustris]|uniref:Uncharacterized protein n=1 Tax=Zizania palustris TaxID=103762 RepID=A0A8J5W6Q2_ZIZPA|nr:hypothetical protein GUJ93_ZPchr0014g47317 [Zizania palustris]
MGTGCVFGGSINHNRIGKSYGGEAFKDRGTDTGSTESGNLKLTKESSEFDGKGEKKSDEEDHDAEPKNGDDDVEMKDRDIKCQKNYSKDSLGMKISCSAPAKMASTYNTNALADKEISTTSPGSNISLSPTKMEAFVVEPSVILETPLSQ